MIRTIKKPSPFFFLIWRFVEGKKFNLGEVYIIAVNVMVVLEGETSSECSVKRPTSHAVEEEVQLW